MSHTNDPLYFQYQRHEERVESDRQLLNAVRNALQHNERSSHSLGRICQTTKDGVIEEELVWSRRSVVWTHGGVIQRHWEFPDTHEEIRTACWAHFEEPGTQRMDPGSQRGTNSSPVADVLEEEAVQVFGSYGKVMRDSEKGFSAFISPDVPSNGMVGAGSGEMVRAVCIIFRSFARLYLENGSEHCIHVPFLTRAAWALYPVGLALEREVTPDTLSWMTSPSELEPVLYTLSSPLKAIAPFGLAHQIRYTNRGSTLVYQDDHPHPNTNINTFSGVRNGEKVVHVQHPQSQPHQIIFTVDVRLLMIHCYAYGYSPFNETSPPSSIPDSLPNHLQLDALNRDVADADVNMLPHRISSQEESQGKTASQWILEETPVPAGWRDPRPEQGDSDVEGIDLSSAINAPLLDLQEDDEEEIVGPEYWLQQLTSFPINPIAAENWEGITVIGFDEDKDAQLTQRFAVTFASSNDYRLIQLYWDNTIPFISRSSLTATADVLNYPALHAVPVKGLRSHSHDLLVLRPDHSLILLSGDQAYNFGVIAEDASGQARFRVVWMNDEAPDFATSQLVRVKSLVSSSGSNVMICLDPESGDRHVVSFAFVPRNRLTREVLSALHYSLPSPDFNSLRRRQLQRWMSDGMPCSLTVELGCLWNALSEVIGWDNTTLDQEVTMLHDGSYDSLAYTSSQSRFAHDVALSGFHIPERAPVTSNTSALSALAAPVLLGLHLLCQALRTDTKRVSDLDHILRILLPLSRKVAPSWADYWSRLRPDLLEAWDGLQGDHTTELLPSIPPDFITHCLQGSPWVELPSIANIFGFASEYSFYSSHEPIFSRQYDLSSFFTIIRQNSRLRDIYLAEALCFSMVEKNWQLEALDTLPMSLATPLREVLRMVQISPKMSYSPETYKLIDRADLFEFARGTSTGYEMPTTDDALPSNMYSIQLKIARLCNGAPATEAGTSQLPKDMFTKIRWTEDRRLEEVQLMLQASRIPAIKIQYTLPPSEHEKENSNLVLRVSERTLSLAPGRALFTYGCLFTATPDAYIIPRIELAVRIMPMNQIIVLEPGKLTMETKTWADFHNGVASGLRLSPHSTSIESSWIQYAKPSELTAEHAGFLFGLGLNGHLKHVDTWNTFSYLSPKHEQTSMALLLGLAASNVGSSSHYITRLIAVHTPALLPIRTVDINVSLLTQSAGLVAMGLVFLGTGDRRLADVALQEISRGDIMIPSRESDNREAYTLSAALAFGMIMVGRGAKVHSAADNVWLNRLRLLIHGERKSLDEAELPVNLDLNITAPGACLALAMMYLKSGRQDVADIVSIPTTRVAINSVPPNLLLLRTLAKSLILWDTISPSTDWVNAQYAPMKASAGSRGAADPATSNALDIANYNIVAGACMAIALKYAGTAQEDALKVIVYYYDVLVRGVYANARTYDHSIRRQATRDAINVLSCCLAMVMAGSGDVDCLQRLRYAHGKYSAPSKFGMHMANHMAMGMLFLGGGRYTIGNSDAAICALLISFYPRFPLFGYDNRFHLQALRHLWVLAVEPRCLTARDVDSGKAILLPVKIKVIDGEGRAGSMQLLAPTLTPGYDAMRSLRVDSPRYWPLFVDYEQMPRFREAFIRNQTLWVKRRRGFLPYNEDPQCTRSSFVVSSGGAAGDIVCLDTPELIVNDEQGMHDFNKFITSFKEDSRIAAFADKLCSDQTQTVEDSDTEKETSLHLERAWVIYCQAALIDCFAVDKPAMLASYMDLQDIRTRKPEESSELSASMIDLVALQTWYRQVAITRPLVRSQIIKSVFLRSAAKLQTLRQDTTFMQHLRDYVNGRTINESDSSKRRIAGKQLAFYLTESETPSAASLAMLKKLYVRTVQAGVSKGLSPDSLRSALMMVMKETVSKSMNLEWHWHSIADIIVCWREG